MNRGILIASLTNTPISVDEGRVGQVQTIEAYNSGVTGAFVKLYQSLLVPTGASVPTWSRFVPNATAVTIPPSVDGSGWWIAVATEVAAGLSAPASPFQVSIIFRRA